MVRKLVLVLGGIALVLGALVLLLQTGAASERVRALVVPRVSAALGRELTVESARLRILPRPRVALRGATLAGRPGEPPLARLASLDVELGLWPLVRSLGEEIRVDGLALVRPEVNLVRGRDGSWNFEGLGRRPAQGEAPARPEAEAEAEAGASLRVAQARIEDGSLRVIDRSQGRDDAAVALTRIDLAAAGGLGHPTEAELTAALAGAEKNVELALRSPRLPERPGAGAWPELTGELALRGLELRRLRGFLPANLAAMFTGGRVDAEAELRSEAGAAAYLLEGAGRLSELRMKGEPAAGGFRVAARAEPASGAATLDVTELAVKGPGVDLGGTAALELPAAGPARGRFALEGPLLDLGTVLGLVPAGPDASPAPPPAPDGALLPPALAEQVAGVAVAGTIELGRLVNGKLTATDLRAKAALRGGVLAVEEATAALYGGRLDAGGTEVALAEPHPRWRLRAKLDAVDLGAAFQAVTGAAPLAGRASGSLDLAGVGSNWGELSKVLSGLGAVSLREGALTTADLGGQALGALAQGLERLGRGGAARKIAGLGDGRTALRDLAASFTVKDGFLALTRPLAFATPVGEARLGGRVGLAQQLDLDGTLAVSREALARAGLPPLGAGPVSLPLELGGTLGAPSVSFSAEQALRGAAAGIVSEKKEAVRGEVERRARRGAEGLLDRLGR